MIDARKMLIEIISLIDNDKIDRNDKKYLCKIINYIYKDIYKILGYKEYNNNLWIIKTSFLSRYSLGKQVCFSEYN